MPSDTNDDNVMAGPSGHHPGLAAAQKHLDHVNSSDAYVDFVDVLEDYKSSLSCLTLARHLWPVLTV